MSDLKCWTRYNKKGGKYVVCNDSKGQKKSKVNYMSDYDEKLDLDILLGSLTDTEDEDTETEEEETPKPRLKTPKPKEETPKPKPVKDKLPQIFYQMSNIDNNLLNSINKRILDKYVEEEIFEDNEDFLRYGQLMGQVPEFDRRGMSIVPELAEEVEDLYDYYDMEKNIVKPREFLDSIMEGKKEKSEKEIEELEDAVSESMRWRGIDEYDFEDDETDEEYRRRAYEYQTEELFDDNDEYFMEQDKINKALRRQKLPPNPPKLKQTKPYQPKMKPIPIIQDAIDSYKYDIIPMDTIKKGIEREDKRQQFLQRDRRGRFLEKSNKREAEKRRRQFSRTLSNPNEFTLSQISKTEKPFKPPQEPVNPRYIKRMEKTKKQIAEGNYKSKQAEYRAKRQMKSLTEYLDLDAKSKKAKSKKEYDSIRKQMDEGEFMKWERYNTAKNKKAQAKRKNKK
tara:strand:- start:4905 stop:6260 length:1356 start_codon:yes stop_codon:yes gene_type:complete